MACVGVVSFESVILFYTYTDFWCASVVYVPVSPSGIPGEEGCPPIQFVLVSPSRLERRRLCSGRGLGRARPPQDGSRLDMPSRRWSRAGVSLPPLSGSRLVHVAKHVFSAPRAQPVVGVRRLGCWLVLLDPLRQRHCASDTGGRTSCERKRQSLYLERTSRPCVAEWQSFGRCQLVCHLWFLG